MIMIVLKRRRYQRLVHEATVANSAATVIAIYMYAEYRQVIQVSLVVIYYVQSITYYLYLICTISHLINLLGQLSVDSP